MRFLSERTNKKWAPTLLPTDKNSPDFKEVPENLLKLQKFLTDLMLSENLIVLCSLGTTLCIKDQKGQVLGSTMGDLWGAAKIKAGAQFEEIREKVKYTTPASGDNIETLLSHCQLSQSLQPDKNVETFISETESLIVEKCRFVSNDTNLPEHEAFLLKMARRSTHQPRMKLFTTNYDLCFETAASHTRFVVVDGFSHTQPQEFDGIHFNYDFVRRDTGKQVPDYIPNVFHLYKIHGSVDWELMNNQIIKTPKPNKPLIIYPRHSKFELSYEQPFLEMMSCLQVHLRQANTGLLIIGSGFNDHHITQPIMSALKSNISLKAMLVRPSLDKTDNQDITTFRNLILGGDSRLALFSARFEELIPIFPDLVAATEEERHFERFRLPQAPK